jgi:ribosomal protein L37E
MVITILPEQKQRQDVTCLRCGALMCDGSAEKYCGECEFDRGEDVRNVTTERF